MVFSNIPQNQPPQDSTTQSQDPAPTQVPGNLGLPLIGESVAMFADANRFVYERVLKYGPVFQTHIFGEKTIIITDPQLVKHFMRKEDKIVKSKFPAATINMIGQRSLLGISDYEHKKARMLMGKAFTPTMIEGMIPQITAQVKEGFEAWADMNDGYIHDLSFQVKRLAFRIMYTNLFKCPGCDFAESELDNMLQDMEAIAGGVFSLPLNIPFSAYNRAKRARARIDAALRPKIRKVLEMEATMPDVERRPSNPCWLERMIAARDKDTGEQFTEDDLVDNSILVLFAGHDTTSHSLLGLLLFLNSRPDVVAKLHKEQQDVVAKHGTGYSRASVKTMTYLDTVVKEFLQVFPTVAGVFRETIEDIDLPGYGYKVTKGTTLLLRILESHHFQNPSGAITDLDERFLRQIDPDRAYAARTTQAKDPRVFCTFGDGRRTCPGRPLAEMEIRIFLAELVRNYSFKVAHGNCFPEMNTLPFQHPKQPVQVRFHRKHQTPSEKQLQDDAPPRATWWSAFW